MRNIVSAPDEEGKKAALEQVISGLGLLEEAFPEGKPFFGGDHIGLLDIALGSILGWIKVTELLNGFKRIDPAKMPKLAQWADNFCADPAVASVMPETGKLAEFAKFLFAKLKESHPSSK